MKRCVQTKKKEALLSQNRFPMKCFHLDCITNYKRVGTLTVKEINSNLKFIVLLHLHVSMFCEYRHYIVAIPTQTLEWREGSAFEVLKDSVTAFSVFFKSS